MTSGRLRIDLSGNIYGKLKVLSYAKTDWCSSAANRVPHWNCVCACGDEITVSGRKLKSGKKKGCLSCSPHSKLKDITGKRFGRLVVQSYVGFRKEYPADKRKKAHWLCKCDCGKEVVVGRGKLKRGTKKSCGCLRSEKKYHPAGIFKTHYAAYLHGAKSRGLEFNLSLDQFLILIRLNCFYCGSPPERRTANRTLVYFANGIDRKNSTLGYTPDNCVPCCKVCNYKKSDTSYQDFLSWIEKVYLHAKAEKDLTLKNISSCS